MDRQARGSGSISPSYHKLTDTYRIHTAFHYITCISLIIFLIKMVSADIALVCGLNFQVGCQDRLRVNSDADEALA